MEKVYKTFSLVLLFCIVNEYGSARAQDTPAEEEVSITNSDEPMFLKTGEKRGFFCKGTAKEKKWFDPRGHQVPERMHELRVHVERMNDHSVLMFADAKLEDNGTWTCASPNLRKTIDIYIVEEVTFEGMKKEESPVEGSRLELECRARGIPTPSLFWYKDGEPASEISSRYHDNSEGKLRIDRVHRNDSGEFECKSMQKIDSKYLHVESVKTLVQVQHPPIMEHDSVVEVFVIMNETKTLRCIATAYPKPIYRWTKTYEERGNYDDDTELSEMTAEDGSYSELSVEVRREEDLRSYTCTVSNSRGKNKTRFHLQLGNKPQPPDKVTFVSATNETLDFEVLCENCTSLSDPAFSPSPDNLPVTHYRFELVNSTTAVDWDNATERVVVAELERQYNKTQYTVEGLQPLTTYQIRAASVNMAGLSEYLVLDPETTAGAPVPASLPALLAAAAALARAICL